MEDRIALLGANGNGKSTFARLLAGRLPPLSGTVQHSPKLRVGFFAQHQAEELLPDASPVQHMAHVLPAALPTALRAQLARFKAPRRVHFVPSLPRNAMGKVQHALLRPTP